MLIVCLWACNAQGMIALPEIALPEDKTPWYTIFKSTEYNIRLENKTWLRKEHLHHIDTSKQVLLTFLSPTHQETITITGLQKAPPALRITRTKKSIPCNQPPKTTLPYVACKPLAHHLWLFCLMQGHL